METRTFLEKVPLFRSFSEEGVSRLVDSFAVLELPRYAILYLQDEIATGSYVLGTGLVKTTKLLQSGEECTLELFFPGEAFGLSALFGTNRRSSNALTLEPSTLLFLPQKELDSLGPDLIQLRINAFGIMDERLRKLEDRFSDLAIRSMTERLASLLVKLSTGKSIETGTTTALPLSQWEIANLIGSTRESVSTALNNFKRKGFLSLKRRHIQIENIDALQEIAGLSHRN